MKHDDLVDALSYQGILIDYMSEGLTEKELDDEHYDEDYKQSGHGDIGRNEQTGY